MIATKGGIFVGKKKCNRCKEYHHLSEYNNKQLCKRCKEKLRKWDMESFWSTADEIMKHRQLPENKIQPNNKWKGSKEYRKIK